MARQRGDSWQADAMVGGKRTRRSFATLADAEAFERTSAAQITDTTIGHLFTKWAREIYTGTRNERHAIRRVDEMVALLGKSLPIHEVTRSRIKDVVAGLKDKGNKPATINTKLSGISRLLSYAVDEEVLTATPKMPFLQVDDGRIRSLTKDEEQAIFEHLTPRYRTLSTFLLHTGCRMGEALALQWSDISDEGATFWRTKSNRPRTVPLNATARAALDRSLSSPFGDVVYDAYYHNWIDAREAAGLGEDKRIVPYVLRHTCATRLAKGKVDPLRMQKWLGHANLKMTSRYTHLDTSDLVNAGDVLEDA